MRTYSGVSQHKSEEVGLQKQGAQPATPTAAPSPFHYLTTVQAPPTQHIPTHRPAQVAQPATPTTTPSPTHYPTTPVALHRCVLLTCGKSNVRVIIHARPFLKLLRVVILEGLLYELVDPCRHSSWGHPWGAAGRRGGCWGQQWLCSWGSLWTERMAGTGCGAYPKGLAGRGIRWAALGGIAMCATGGARQHCLVRGPCSLPHGLGAAVLVLADPAPPLTLAFCSARPPGLRLPRVHWPGQRRRAVPVLQN